MPILGIGIHVLIALIFAIHAMRTGQQMYWLIILFSFPLLGSIVYFVVIFLPNSRLQRGAIKAVTAAAKAIDPSRELRDATSAFEYTPTAQNQMRLAAALLEAGRAEEAATNYEACLKGPFASDPQIRFGAARSYSECGRFEQAISHLNAVRQADPTFRPEQLTLLLARAYSGAGQSADAQAEFASAVDRFGSFEARAEYAIWAVGSGDLYTANRLHVEIEQARKHWNRHTRELNGALLRRVDNAFASHVKRT